MIHLLGLPLEKAVSALREADIDEIEIKEISAPRGSTPRGTLRVVRIEKGGKIVTCARFPDDVKENGNEA